MVKEEKYMVSVLAMIGCGLVIIASVYIWGPDNEIEEEAEEVLVQIIHEDLEPPVFKERKNAVHIAPNT